MVVRAIATGSSKVREGLAIISKIRKIIEKHEDVRVCYSFKEVNRCVDALASIRYNMSLDIEIYFYR